MDVGMGSRCRVEGRRFSGNSGGEVERLFEEQASLKNRGRSEEFRSPWRKNRGRSSGAGGPRRSGIRCRDGAGADGIRVRTASSPRGLGPEGILDSDTLARGICISGPHRRARKIGVQTAPAARFVPARCLAVPLRPKPVPSARGLAHRMRPRENPCPQPRSLDRSSASGECSKFPSGGTRSDGAFGGETDANHCHTDANHCHILPSPAQSAPETLSSSPEP